MNSDTTNSKCTFLFLLYNHVGIILIVYNTNKILNITLCTMCIQFNCYAALLNCYQLLFCSNIWTLSYKCNIGKIFSIRNTWNIDLHIPSLREKHYLSPHKCSLSPPPISFPHTHTLINLNHLQILACQHHHILPATPTTVATDTANTHECLTRQMVQTPQHSQCLWNEATRGQWICSIANASHQASSQMFRSTYVRHFKK